MWLRFKCITWHRDGQIHLRISHSSLRRFFLCESFVRGMILYLYSSGSFLNILVSSAHVVQLHIFVISAVPLVHFIQMWPRLNRGYSVCPWVGQAHWLLAYFKEKTHDVAK